MDIFLKIITPLLIAIILISAYKSGINILYKSIEFAINEYKPILNNEKIYQKFVKIDSDNSKRKHINTHKKILSY